MTPSAAVSTILLAILLGAMIPGPSFVMVALGGLYTLLFAVEWLYVGLKIAGGVYLVYIALRIWRGASQPLSVSTVGVRGATSAGRSFWLGLSTQLSNPKTAIWYGSILAALLPLHPPLWCYLVLPSLVFVVEFGWYMVVAMCFSSRRPRELYLRARTWIDRIAATLVGALGLRLIIAAGEGGI
ncbi:LysE family transporter [Caballeronia sp. LZ062]|uniref:LysE family translocator n=1 Tax=unclassified Caballeronia TaxID=2646786 RepID=UPI0028645F83|nr:MULTISPECIES: LysE family transporter [unclassified Caballeronia]MDR5856019.1 LysE family transporter [Caballeronia sp. LZ050]MDR5872689.1 LysE family transporter [Caballeronia sp. LZ062]